MVQAKGTVITGRLPALIRKLCFHCLTPKIQMQNMLARSSPLGNTTKREEGHLTATKTSLKVVFIMP
jgi:hypothetical protein